MDHQLHPKLLHLVKDEKQHLVMLARDIRLRIQNIVQLKKVVVAPLAFHVGVIGLALEAAAEVVLAARLSTGLPRLIFIVTHGSRPL